MVKGLSFSYTGVSSEMQNSMGISWRIMRSFLKSGMPEKCRSFGRFSNSSTTELLIPSTSNAHGGSFVVVPTQRGILEAVITSTSLGGGRKAKSVKTPSTSRAIWATNECEIEADTSRYVDNLQIRNSNSA